jgi:hypothetical protein
MSKKQIPVAKRSMGRIYGRSLAGAAGSNPAGGMHVCLLRVLCVARQRSLRRADPSSRGFLSTVLCQKPDEQSGPGPRLAVSPPRERETEREEKPTKTTLTRGTFNK